MPGTRLEEASELPSRTTHSRRDFLALGVGLFSSAVLAAACGENSGTTAPPRGTTAKFVSRPDLEPVLIDVTRGTGSPGPGYICVTPSGPMLVDDTGQPIWVRPVQHAATNLRVQDLKGQPVLTWWEGEITHYGVGQAGEFVIVDGSYREVMRVRAHNGLPADLHEFIITGDGIAYFTAYRHYTTDLRSIGGPEHGEALDATVQGVDLATGDLVFDWHSADHIDLKESYQTYSKTAPFDPVHLNSIDTTADGKLLFSARNTWALYKIDPESGEILWRLGGKKSDFDLGPGVRFAWQHDARDHGDGTITLFDDEGDPPEAKQSRGMRVQVDEAAHTVSLAQEFHHTSRSVLAGSQGSMQVLPGGNVFVGWGAEPYYTEYSADGSLVLDAKFAHGQSYRAFRFDWTGMPTEKPVVAVKSSGGRQRSVYASWNGSTQTASWQLLAGSAPGTLVVVDEVERQGFETVISLKSSAQFVAVRSLDKNGKTLGQSKTIPV